MMFFYVKYTNVPSIMAGHTADLPILGCERVRNDLAHLLASLAAQSLHYVLSCAEQLSQILVGTG